MTSYSKFLILIASTLIFMALPTQAHAERCFAPKPVLGFQSTISNTKFNISESAFDLHRMHGGGQGGGLVTGLAFSPLYYEFQGLFNITQTDKGYCVALDKIKMAYRARPIVFISSEFPRGSCEFNAVLRHENKHVGALKKVHARTTADFKAHVQNSLERLRPTGPVSKSQIESTQGKMQDLLSALLDEHLIEANNTLARAQNRIDSPSEYERVNDECDQWAGRLRLE